MATILFQPRYPHHPPPLPVSNRFGVGSATGSYESGVWAPAFDSAGLVNAASWAIVPSGEWFQVANTRLDGLDAAVKAELPGWTDYGTGRWEGVATGWNGLTIDVDNSRVWFVCAGGHADSSNNGIYRFDCFRMTWAVEHMPSDSSSWSATYRDTGRAGGNFTVCAESLAEMNARKTAGSWGPINDWSDDELFWDRKPTSRHVYSGTAYNASTQELILTRGKRLWRYSLVAGRWTYKRLHEDGIRPWYGSNAYAHLDEVRGQLLIGTSTDVGVYPSTQFDLATNAYSTWVSPWAIWGGCDTRNGRNITNFSALNSGTGIYNGKYWVYNLDSRSVVAGGNGAAVQFGPGLTRAEMPRESWYYDGYSICEIPPLNEYWYWTMLSSTERMELLRIDKSTTPWTISRKATVGNVPNPNKNVLRKMIWMPQLNAVLLVDRASNNVYLYKV